MVLQQTIIALPHAGNTIPEELEHKITIDFDEERYDKYSLEIYSPLSALGPLIEGKIHRELIDYNRDRDNLNPIKGVLPEYGFHGTKNLTTGHTPEEQEQLLSNYWDTYQQSLETEVKKQMDTYGKVLIIAGHTMEGIGPKNAPDAGKDRADIVIGTLDGTLAEKKYLDSFIQYLKEHAKEVSIEVDTPYKGAGFITRHYGKPKQGYNIIQIEVNINSYEDMKKTKEINDLIFRSVEQLTKQFQSTT